MVYSIEVDIYLVFYGFWKDLVDEVKYVDWVWFYMVVMLYLVVGIQFVDENFGVCLVCFVSDVVMVKFDWVCVEYDFDGLFNSWMGRI